MSFPKIEAELQEVKTEIHEINETIKQLVIQMQLINLTFERMLKPKQKREYQPLEIKLPEKINPQSDDEKFIQRFRANILQSQSQENPIQKLIEAQNKQIEDKREDESQ